MDKLGLWLLYVVGVGLLAADLFLPSYGILSLASLGVLGYALYLTYQIGPTAGLIATVALAAVVPTLLILTVKVWHRTPIGRRISPPNPVLGEKDRLPVSDLERLIGTTGRAVTMMRPVGMCLFEGRRIECVSEQGVINTGTAVEAIRLADRTVVVRVVSAAEPA